MRTVRMSDFGGSGRYNEYKESGRMPEELLEYFKRKARYGMKFQDSGRYGDTSNLRVLQSPEGKNQFFVKTDGGYDPIDNPREAFGDKAYDTWLGEIGMSVERDPKTGRVVSMSEADDNAARARRGQMDPFAYQSKMFREEYFPEFGENEKAMAARYYEENQGDPSAMDALKGMPTGAEYDQLRAEQLLSKMDPATRRRTQQQYMLDQLMGGRRQGGGGQ